MYIVKWFSLINDCISVSCRVPASINWLSVCELSVLLVGWLCLGPGLHPGMHDSSFSLLFYVLIVSVILRIGFVYPAPVFDNCLPSADCFSFTLSLMAIYDTQAWHNQVCVLWLCFKFAPCKLLRVIGFRIGDYCSRNKDQSVLIQSTLPSSYQLLHNIVSWCLVLNWFLIITDAPAFVAVGALAVGPCRASQILLKMTLYYFNSCGCGPSSGMSWLLPQMSANV